MIQDGFAFIAFLMFVSSIVIWGEDKYKNGSFFKYVPAVIIIYFSAMVMSTLGVWEMTDSVKQARGEVKTAILPAMIFLMLLRADLRDIVKLGPKLLGTFFAATLSIVLGFIVSFALFQSYLNDNAALTFGALAGSWIGGTQNMVAVQQSLGLNDAGMGYTLLIDSIDYAMWIMFLLALVPFAHKFNAWTKADTSTLDELQKKLTLSNDKIRKETTFPDMMLLLGSAFGLSALAIYISGLLPHNAVLTSTTWSIMIVTIVGVICAMTPLGKLPGSPQLSNVLLYTLVGLIAANADFAELTQAPAYILAGFVILLIHGVILTVIAKIFKLDLFTCGIASLANIGGVASSPVLAAAYSQTLVPVAILMALMGVIIGTGAGIGVAMLLQAM
ncbi:DUF819 family protein [Pseudoalteromonas luteoviolacea]|uniref:DUF819 domain-containing protein n=1 Tax=Pseudoalteromonas luteoviolacea H33 TaxID=1365251 RepID=A0A167DYN4_9GAMM|nr:DUF819 family protein [Pseudoalteromonas luteoviolacea]KZN49762.1 hypothetical protein N476_18390 [Pseudoalteromonas luteoviolacea H33]KZN77786.1 hypothetical protein N477_00845 [Pseudoalteromonas luteoviolacea H33-S]MBQ4878730.1 DUF819 domain-containing protein [Pseudoalteromonas luteoviolacea]MBQ4907862.1 DUF819 domain-containing protein [Pseudoalteromonas luteoviolacea]